MLLPRVLPPCTHFEPLEILLLKSTVALIPTARSLSFSSGFHHAVDQRLCSVFRACPHGPCPGFGVYLLAFSSLTSSNCLLGYSHPLNVFSSLASDHMSSHHLNCSFTFVSISCHPLPKWEMPISHSVKTFECLLYRTLS